MVEISVQLPFLSVKLFFLTEHVVKTLVLLTQIKLVFHSSLWNVMLHTSMVIMAVFVVLPSSACYHFVPCNCQQSAWLSLAFPLHNWISNCYYNIYYFKLGQGNGLPSGLKRKRSLLTHSTVKPGKIIFITIR